jgi:hypothetical protein
MNYREEIISGRSRVEVLWAAYAINSAMVAVAGDSYSKAVLFSALAAAPRTRQERAAHVELIREVVGNPFRPVVVDASWLRWNDGTVVKVTRGIYEERAFGRMPILHDALLDAGCADEALLSHCRNPEGHVHGCWALDQILGKE